MKRCTHASVRRMGLQILCFKALSRLRLPVSGGDLIERERWPWLLITYAHTYATVILEVLEQAVRLASETLVIDYKRKTERRQSSFVPSSGGAVGMMSLARARSTLSRQL
jgi:hypothetical protein